MVFLLMHVLLFVVAIIGSVKGDLLNDDFLFESEIEGLPALGSSFQFIPFESGTTPVFGTVEDNSECCVTGQMSVRDPDSNEIYKAPCFLPDKTRERPVLTCMQRIFYHAGCFGSGFDAPEKQVDQYSDTGFHFNFDFNQLDSASYYQSVVLKRQMALQGSSKHLLNCFGNSGYPDLISKEPSMPYNSLLSALESQHERSKSYKELLEKANLLLVSQVASTDNSYALTSFGKRNWFTDLWDRTVNFFREALNALINAARAVLDGLRKAYEFAMKILSSVYRVDLIESAVRLDRSEKSIKFRIKGVIIGIGYDLNLHLDVSSFDAFIASLISNIWRFARGG